MKIVVAPNALKGSLDAVAACRAIVAGLAHVWPEAEYVEAPVADGGDGTAEVLVRHWGGVAVAVPVCDPLGRPMHATVGWVPATRTAVLDVASASGLGLLRERTPATASTFGTGLLLRAALDLGAQRVLVGLGGSATVDLGAGAMEALGVRFLDGQGSPLPRGGGALGRLARIDRTGLHPRLRREGAGDAEPDSTSLVELVCLCDVDSPLTGHAGAAQAFGAQKGAAPPLRRELERNLEHAADVVARELGVQMRGLRHGGAAGGMAAGLWAILGARLERGIDRVLAELAFDQMLEGADLVVTAEGQLDAQTLEHKAPHGVALAARARGVPVALLVGGVDGAWAAGARDTPFDAVLPIPGGPMDLHRAMAEAAPQLTAASERLATLLRLGARLGGAGQPEPG